MRGIRWAGAARTDQLQWLLYLADRNPQAADDAADDIEEKVAHLPRRPLDHRPSRWRGLREMSLPRWSKIVVYQVTDEEIIVIAFLDPRQDLTALQLKPEE